MSDIASIRSWLFVPGDSAKKQEKGAASGADALIFDLEDSVARDLLRQARALVCDALRSRKERVAQQLWVRVNALSSGQLLEDLAVVMPGVPDGIVLPKVSREREVAEVSRHLAHLERDAGAPAGATKLMAIVTETPQALFGLGEFASAANPRLAGMTWGAEDLSAALGASPREADGSFTFTFELVRSMCLLASGAAGVASIDTVCVDFRDTAALTREAERACRDGFSGKLAIHPAQIGPINAAFSPQAPDVDRARQIVAAFAAAPDAGVLSIDGKMLDRPHLIKAQRLLERAARASGRV